MVCDKNKKNNNRGARAFVCLIAAAVFGFAGGGAFAEEPLTYRSPETGCDLLSAEYNRIKNAARRDSGDRENRSVTKEGVMMTFGMILTAPFALFSEVFGGGARKLDFSGDPDDIFAAAKTKQCAALLTRMEADKNAGHYPPPIVRDH